MSVRHTLSIFLLLGGLAWAEPQPPYIIFDDVPLKGAYFYSGVESSGQSWLDQRQGKLPCVAEPAHSPGASLQLNYLSAPQGSWQARVQRHPIRGLDEWDNGVFIAARPTPYAAPAKLRLWLRGPLSAPPQLAILLAEDKPGPWTSLPVLATDRWTAFDLPLSVSRAEDVKGIVLRQAENSEQEQHLLIDDIEILSAQPAPLLPAPHHLQVESGSRHVDLSWQGPPCKRAWIERALPGDNFRPYAIKPYWLQRFCDYRGSDGRPYRYRVRLENAAGELGPPSAEVRAGTRPGDHLEMVQRACLRYYWEGAEPNSGLCLESRPGDPHMLAVGASGFGLMALLVGAERGFLKRPEVLQRFERVVTFLEKADRFHGVFPHYLDGRTGKIIAFFGPDDNGGDLVETSFMMQGLLAARQYFDRDTPQEIQLRKRLTRLWEEVEWDWHRSRDNPDFLLWHWSPDKGFKMNHPLVGWNETMITYILAMASPTHAVPDSLYASGWAGQSQRARDYRGNQAGSLYSNGNRYQGVRLPVGVQSGGPLFFTHYSFLGLDPHGLKDRFTEYFENNRCIAEINRRYCQENGYAGLGWGLTASDGPWGYHPDEPQAALDKGKLTPTGALASMPYLPQASREALEQYYVQQGDFCWGEYGFRDAFSPRQNWVNDLYMGLNQAPIVIMVENYRSGLIWRVFGKNPEIRSLRGRLFR